MPDEKPRITGIKEKYQVRKRPKKERKKAARPIINAIYQIGERMEALCTSWQSHPPANLTWFINEEKVRNNKKLTDKVKFTKLERRY